MRKSVLSILMLALVLCTGCDGLRKLAGRPTSADIRDKMEIIERARQEAYQRMQDSLALVEKHKADSIAAADSIAQAELQLSKEYQAKGTIKNPAKMGGLFTTKLDYKYYIVVGAFSARQNAEKKLDEVQKAGYTGTIISFRNGFNAVGISQTDDLGTALDNLKKAKAEKFCPDDAWIMVNE